MHEPKTTAATWQLLLSRVVIRQLLARLAASVRASLSFGAFEDVSVQETQKSPTFSQTATKP